MSTAILFKTHIAGAVQRNVLTASATVKDIELTLGKWLTRARNRGGKCADRAKETKKRKLQQEAAAILQCKREKMAIA